MSNNISMFTDEEIRGIREGIDGIKRPLPARCYYDKDFYQFEVEHILKKNWLCVGRWDQVEKPGDYFTLEMFGESIVIVRDRNEELHALINVCQHRWSQVVDDGSGNANMFTCPYHRWTYNLDGSLRGVSVKPIKELDKKKCSMPKLAIEMWHGFIFVNFDFNAEPLAPRLEPINHLLEKHEVSKYRLITDMEYQTTWNWKFSFETGYEAYHHAGVHCERINHIEPASGAVPIEGSFGEICGAYMVPFVDDVPMEFVRPFGPPPGTREDDPKEIDTFVAVYPALIMYLNSSQVTWIQIKSWQDVDSNAGSTRQAIAHWANERPGYEEVVEIFKGFTTEVQKEDSYACSMLQKGIRSRSNRRGVIHPLEPQLNHYHNWYLDQVEKASNT